MGRGGATRAALYGRERELAVLTRAIDAPAARALGGPGLERPRLLEAVRRTLGRAARRPPLALLLDDVQWADPASLALLGYLARGLASSRLLLLLTYRSGEDADGPGG